IMPSAFKGQKFSSLRSDCLSKGVLFEDPEFPANNKSLFFSKIDNDIEWKRPKELCKVPKLVVEGVSCDDLNQGELGNTWFVTACSSLTLEKKLFQTVVPDIKDQEWDERSEKNKYAGIFHFRFWRYGEWIDIVIDDRLPTKDGKLCFCHSKSRNEFWSALLEKAYAKLYGDYESLQNGKTADAMVDFTGGVAEKIELSKLNMRDEENKLKLFGKMKEAVENKSLVNCNIQCQRTEVGKELPQGLILGHGYNVTKVLDIKVDKKHQGAVGNSILKMVRLSNPWGTKEWNGPWADDSPEWGKLNKTEWEKLGLKFQQEGEFWMNFDDFLANFSNVDICHFVNTSIISISKTWSEAIFHGEWTVSGRNGGGDFQSATFLSNPQYRFDINGPTDRVMVSLEQHDMDVGRQSLGIKLNNIGFHIMKVEQNRIYRVHIPGDLTFVSEYLNSRSVFGIMILPRGRYVIVPTTKESGQTGQFMLRLYTGSSAGAKCLLMECPPTGCPCRKNPTLVSTITVESCAELEIPPLSKVKTMDPYVIIKCEGEKVKSEVWNANTLIDDYIAEARVEEHGSEDGDLTTQKLFGRKKEADQEKPGSMKVHIRSSHDMTYL
ncbi:hypothetical protein FSP39_019019, partial [Pinctada imbricata]